MQAKYQFEHDLGDKVIIRQNSREGVIIGLHVDQHENITYNVRYTDVNALIVDRWFTSAELAVDL